MRAPPATRLSASTPQLFVVATIRSGLVQPLVPKCKRGRPSRPSWEISDMPDMEITCAECGNTFPFTEREQEYYQERNLTHPKRCKPCRDARRSNFGGPRGGGDRQRFEITCDQCGKNDSVPFKPSSGRPVLCGECFSANRAAQPRT